MISNESENAACAPMRRKPRKRSVWVLEWLVDYEPGHIHGVFSSKKRAEKAQAVWKATEPYQPDDWQITKHTMDT